MLRYCLVIALLFAIVWSQTDDGLSFDDGSFDDGSFDDGSVESYDDGSFDDGSFDDGSVESNDDGSFDDGSFDDGSVESNDDGSDSDSEDSVESVESVDSVDSVDSDTVDPNGFTDVRVDGQVVAKMLHQTLDLEDDIQRDVATVLDIPESAVDVLSVRATGNRYTAVVRLFDSQRLSSQQAADELRELERTNDPRLQNTSLENADVVVLDSSNSRSLSDSSSASALMFSAVLLVPALFIM